MLTKIPVEVWFFIVLVIIGTIPYSNSLNAPFHFDDYPNIVENPALRITSLSPSEVAKAAHESPSSNHRWLSNISFALNYYFNGLDVKYYRLVNIVVHLITALLVYLVAQTTLALPVLHEKFPRHREVAFAAAALWMVHPVQTNAVTYVVQRMTSMSAMFYMLALLLFIFAFNGKDKLAHKKYFLFIGCFLSTILAILCKENTAVIPFVFLGYYFYFLRSPEEDASRYFLGFGVALAAFLVLTLFLTDFNPIKTIESGYDRRDFTPFERLLTQPRVIFYYLTLIILPLPSRLTLTYDFEISKSLLTPSSSLFAIIGLICLVAFIFRLFQRDRLISFAILWFLANLLIESSILPLEIIFEHRIYLPLVFVAIAIVASLYRIFQPRVIFARSTLLAIITLFSLFTWQRNAVWTDEITFWSDAAAKSPNLSRVYENLGVSYKKRGNLHEAEKNLLKAIELDARRGNLFLNLSVVYQMADKLDYALEAANRALTLDEVNIAAVYSNIGVIHLKKKQFDQALTALHKAIETDPGFMGSHINLALAYRDMGKLDIAEMKLKEIMNLDPTSGEPYYLLGKIYETQNRLDEAFQVLRIALTKYNAQPEKVHDMLAVVFWRQKDYDKAVRECEIALEINPAFAKTHVTMGIALEDWGRQKEAFRQFRLAWDNGIDMVGLYNTWASRYLMKGNPVRALVYINQALLLEPDNEISQKYYQLAQGQQERLRAREK